MLEQGKDPDDIIKDVGKNGFLKFLEKTKLLFNHFIWDFNYVK